MAPDTAIKQQAILDATLELVGERGFHGTPISAIAERAGVGAGTIYRYYASKEDLINALYVREKTQLNTEILAGYYPGQSVRFAIGQIWRNTLAARATHPVRFRFLDQYYNSPYIGDESGRVREQLMTEFVEIIERGIRDGTLRDLPRPVLLAVIFGPIANLASTNQLWGIAVDDELVEEALAVVWRGIGTE